MNHPTTTLKCRVLREKNNAVIGTVSITINADNCGDQVVSRFVHAIECAINGKQFALAMPMNIRLEGVPEAVAPVAKVHADAPIKTPQPA